MKKITNLICVIIITSFFIGCAKEKSFEVPTNTPPPNGGGSDSTNNKPLDTAGITAKLVGTWKFISLASQGTSSASTSSPNTSFVTTFSYTSVNNTGTITFTPTDYTGTDIGYEVHTNLSVESFLNGVSLGSQLFPFDFVNPPASSSGTYHVVTSDSLYFDSGSFVQQPDPVTSGATGVNGVRFTISGNTLSMVNNIVTDADVADSSGLSVHQHATLKSTITLQKQ